MKEEKKKKICKIVVHFPIHSSMLSRNADESTQQQSPHSMTQKCLLYSISLQYPFALVCGVVLQHVFNGIGLSRKLTFHFRANRTHGTWKRIVPSHQSTALKSVVHSKHIFNFFSLAHLYCYSLYRCTLRLKSDSNSVVSNLRSVDFNQ